MLFINATLSKNQLYKHQNQINKVPTSTSKTTEYFSNCFCTPFLMSAIYFRVIIMVGSLFADTRGLCGGITLSFFTSFQLIFRTRLRANFYSSKLLLKQFQKEQIFIWWVLLNIVTLEMGTPLHSNCAPRFHQRKSFITIWTSRKELRRWNFPTGEWVDTRVAIKGYRV